jgi:predicted NUDIX family NTP pyrophosphohydrolase
LEPADVIETAGILLFRIRALQVEVFLVHMGGPFWAKREDGAWSIPKGVIGRSEEPAQAAKREFLEEVGTAVTGNVVFLGRFRQNSGKALSVWAVEGDVDADTLKSNTFSMVWPPKSGRVREFPEADRGGWFAREDAAAKIVAGQRKILDAFFRSR